jgi:hypothetical protein
MQLRWMGALAVGILWAAAARADEVKGTLVHGDLKFEAVDAMAFFSEPVYEPSFETRPVAGRADGSAFHVMFTDFPIDREDALGDLDTYDGIAAQARRAGGRIVHVAFDPPFKCSPPSVQFPAHQPRIRPHGTDGAGPFSAAARTVGDRVIGRCEGRSEPAATESYAFEFRVDLRASERLYLVPHMQRPTHGPGGGEPGAVLQALVAAIAARDLATVRRHHGGELPPESADAAAIDRFFDILSRTYPGNVVVNHAWVKDTAARLVVSGNRLGHPLEGTIFLRRKKGEPWRVTDFRLGGPIPRR